MTETDPFNLERFVRAQTNTYRQALAELDAGHKSTHWMWFIFPQLRGLGQSSMAQQYGISSLDEARAYLAHPLLGGRLKECAKAILTHRDKSAREILGSPDDMKLRSCATLFSRAGKAPGIYKEILDAFYSGEPDQRTLDLLGA
jgi:uncharacterized protein (DUF1810 family)